MLVIEYDVNSGGEIELVALINAIDEDGQDPDGTAWMAWRQTHPDEGLGCVPVPPDQLCVLEQTEDPEELRTIVERIILGDRAGKEQRV
jgi:hypothetical protein